MHLHKVRIFVKEVFTQDSETEFFTSEHFRAHAHFGGQPSDGRCRPENVDGATCPWSPRRAGLGGRTSPSDCPACLRSISRRWQRSLITKSSKKVTLDAGAPGAVDTRQPWECQVGKQQAVAPWPPGSPACVPWYDHGTLSARPHCP